MVLAPEQGYPFPSAAVSPIITAPAVLRCKTSTPCDDYDYLHGSVQKISLKVVNYSAVQLFNPVFVKLSHFKRSPLNSDSIQSYRLIWVDLTTS